MRKIAFAIACTMLCAMLPCAAVNAETSVSENFEGSSYLGFTKYSAERESAGVIKTTDVYGMNKAFCPILWSARSDAFGEKTYILDKAQDYENPHNLYMETEFDIVIPKNSGASPIISLMNNETQVFDATFPFGLIMNTSSGKIQLNCKETRRDALKTTIDLCDFEEGVPYRIKTVMHITDNTDSTCEEISEIYVNGENVLQYPKYFLSDNEIKIPYVNSIVLRNAAGILFDNLSVYKYISSDGRSPVVNKGSLVSLIRSTSVYGIDELASAKAVYENEASSQSEVDMAFENLKNTLSPNTLFYEDFENDTYCKFFANRTSGEVTGEESGSLTENVIYPSGKAYITQNGAVNTETFDKVYVFNDTVDTAADFAAQPDKLYMETEFDIMARDSLASPVIGLASDRDSTTVGASIRLNTNENKIQLICRDGKRNAGKLTYLDLSNLEIGKFYRIKLVINVKDSSGNSGEQITAVYVNGKNMIKEPMYFESFSVNKIPYFNRLRMINAKSAMLDNITVRKYISSNGVSPVADKGRLVYLLRKYREYFLSLSTDNKFYKLYSEADEIYRNDIADYTLINNVCEKISEAEIYPFEIKSYYSESAGGKSGRFIYDGGTLKTVTLTKKYGGVTNVRLYAAIYDNSDEVKSVTTYPVTDDGNEIILETEFETVLEGGYIKLFLMAEDMEPAAKSLMIKPWEKNDVFSDTAVYVNGTKYRTDSRPAIYNSGKVEIRAENIINIFGMQLMKNSDVYSCAREDGTTLEFAADERGMIDMDMLADTFGCGYTLSQNGDEARLDITYDYTEPEYSDYSDSGIQINFIKNTPVDIGFEIPSENPNAVYEVWIKMSTVSEQMWSAAEKECLDNGAIYYWKKAYSPYYDNSKKAFCGSVGDMPSGWRAYDVKLAVTENGVRNTYVKRKAFTMKSNDPFPSIGEYVYDTGGELMLVPTYENIGFYIDNDISASECFVYYRIAGEDEWKEAYKPYYDATDNQWRGSITGLRENTEYSVKAILKTDGAEIEKISCAKTWQDNPNIAKTIDASEFVENGTLNIQGVKGTPDAWIKITAANGFIADGGENNSEAVYISDCSYVILDGIKITGGKRTGVLICNGSTNVRIVNCDISGWGRTGVLDEVSGGYRADGMTVNYEAGIRMRDVANVTVEKCYIHDSRAKTTPWVSDTWNWTHPKGSCGIFYRVKDGCVIRYNDIIGCDDYRWNDAIEGSNNGARYGGANKNTDIYGNMLFGCEDDCVEIDGGQMNVRVYNNRMEQALCGISVAPNLAGPSYIFRNLIANMGTSNVRYIGTAIKSGGSDGFTGMMYLFNNTIDSICHSVRNVGYDKSMEFHSVSRNNIFVTRTAGYDAFTNKYADETDNNDYDLISGKTVLKSGDGVHNILAIPEYENDGSYRLKDASQGVDSGEELNNFTETYSGSAPDMGAFERNSGVSFIPYRPLNISADKYLITLREGEEKEITFTSDETERTHTYKILKNNNCKWLNITNDSGVLNSGMSVTVKLSADAQKCGTISGNGVILFKLDNGYSVPISVKLEK